MRRRVYGGVVLAVAAAFLVGLVAAALHTHRGLGPQVHAGFEAFGGLVGVALIGIAALAVLLIADSWMSRHEAAEHERPEPPPRP